MPFLLKFGNILTVLLKINSDTLLINRKLSSN